MPARTPEELDVLFASAINAGDIEALIKLYEPGACLMPEPGAVVSGTRAVREALGGFIAIKPRIRLDVRKLAETDGIALTTSKWVRDAGGSDRGRSIRIRQRHHRLSQFPCISQPGLQAADAPAPPGSRSRRYRATDTDSP